MLGSRRPDIPVLVVQSGQSGGSLNNIPGIDFSRYPQIMAAPPVPTPAEYFALTRILLVPSVWEEPFGRVAAEAMINGIPPLVCNRGALPDVIGGDCQRRRRRAASVPIPDWMTPTGTRIPSEQEIEPWFEAVCALWDDAALYEAVSARGRAIADARYSENVSRAKHVDYFTSLEPGGTLFPSAHFATRRSAWIACDFATSVPHPTREIQRGWAGLLRKCARVPQQKRVADIKIAQRGDGKICQR